jgi:hypothetical protein
VAGLDLEAQEMCHRTRRWVHGENTGGEDREVGADVLKTSHENKEPGNTNVATLSQASCLPLPAS